MAAKLDLRIDKGSTFRHTLTWNTRSAGVITPVDLTGFTARMQIRNKRDGTLLHTLLSSGVGITLGGVLGTIVLFISDTDTAAFTWSTGVYDLELIDTGGTGDVTRLVQGRIAADEEVTV